MRIKNYMDAVLTELPNCHDGKGSLQHIGLFSGEEFHSGVRYFHYNILPPNTSIGLHKHGNDEEVYIILEGTGLMIQGDNSYSVKAGSVIVNPPFGSHSLENTGETDMKLLVFEIVI
ncbi:MAG: mannose-6-phosphate isomerase [Herbinix sp.]|jgi:mannose-6-phosphate isomerase-like protein (cupin superfamily)|nr:mannose-6-phosphate isomerase [Herbinix sp.]